MAGDFRHEQPVLVVDRERDGALEDFFPFVQVLGDYSTHWRLRVQVYPFLAPLGQSGLAGQLRHEMSVMVEYLDPFVFEIGHVDDAVTVDGDPGGPVELPVALP